MFQKFWINLITHIGYQVRIYQITTGGFLSFPVQQHSEKKHSVPDDVTHGML